MLRAPSLLAFPATPSCAALLFVASMTAISARVRPALAQPQEPTSKENSQRAELIFRDAEKLFDERRYPEACAGFAESQRLDPKLGTLLNLAFCHESMGKVATAWSEYNEAAVWASQRGQKEREEFARKRSLDLARRLSRVVLELPPGEEPSAIELDGEALPKQKWLTPLFLDPGEHAIVVRAPGRKTQTVTVHASETTTAQTIKLAPLEPEAPAPVAAPAPSPAPESTETQPPVESGGGAQRTLGFILAGVGLVGIGVGSYFGIRTLSNKSDAASHCDSSNVCDATGKQDFDEAHTFATVSTVAFGIGAAGIVVGTLLVLTAPSSSPTRGARLSPMLGARGNGLVLSGVF